MSDKNKKHSIIKRIIEDAEKLKETNEDDTLPIYVGTVISSPNEKYKYDVWVSNNGTVNIIPIRP